MWCKIIIKSNKLTLIKIEASLFKTRLSKLLRDLCLQSHISLNDLKTPQTREF